MVLPLGGALLGALFGALNARRRGGVALDLWQWGAVGGIVGALAGLFALILVSRAMT